MRTVPAERVRWIDNHCHLPPGHVGDDVVAEAVAAGVHRMIDVGTDAERSRQVIESAARHPGVWATVGVHPHDATEGVEAIVALLDEPGVVAVGECGLDYHYDHSPREVQRAVFAHQIALAHDRGLPLVIHSREAWDDTFDILTAEGVPERTVFHCFTGGPEQARTALDLGAVLSFSGIVTFGSASELREAAALCPLERLLVETDSPYLSPEPLRGKQNAPRNVVLVGERVAELKGTSAAEVASATWDTAAFIYGLPAD